MLNGIDERLTNFRNSTGDSSEGGLGRCGSVDPLNASDRDARGNGSDSDDKDDPEGILRERLKGLKPRERYSP